MRSHDIPAEFEELLSRQGRRVLAGTHPLCGALADPRRRFLMADNLIDRARAALGYAPTTPMYRSCASPGRSDSTASASRSITAIHPGPLSAHSASTMASRSIPSAPATRTRCG